MINYLLNTLVGFSLIKENTYELFYPNRESIYIVGNGWAAYYFAKYLNKTMYRPIIISPNEKVLNTPKLINLIADPNANVEFSNPYATIINDYVTTFDNFKREIYTEKNKVLRYKNVVFAIGSEPNDYGINGVSINSLFLKTKDHAHIIRKQLESDKNNIYIIGSGPTGIELGSLIKNKYNYNISLIEGMDNILPGFNECTKELMKFYLLSNNINLNLDNKVSEINTNKIITLKNTFSYDMVIWTGGVKFNGYNKTELFKKIDSIKKITPRGIETNDDFTIGNEFNVYCIGDMVSNKGPPTAQNAKYHGKWLANYFNQNKNKDWVKKNPFEYKETGKLLHLKNAIYMESNTYNGFVPYIMEKLFDLFM